MSKPRPITRALAPCRRATALRPSPESLEARTLLATTGVASQAEGAAAPDNQSYIAALIGTHRLLSPQEAALRSRLTAQRAARAGRP